MYPPKPFETSVAAFVGDVGKYRLSTTPISEKCAFSREFSLPAMPCSRGFRPLFTRSIKAQDKRPQSQAPSMRKYRTPSRMTSVSPASTKIAIRGLANTKTSADMTMQKAMEMHTALFSPARIRAHARYNL